MSVTVTGIVLIAALMHALWNALLKSSTDRLTELATLNLAAGVIALLALPFVGLPSKESWPFLAVTLAFHCGYYLFLLRSYAQGGLSLVYPIARGASPILVAALSAVVAGERIEALQAAGVFLIAASIASLAFAGGRKHLSSKAVLFSLITSVMIAGYTVTDGSGARVSGSVISYVACLFVMNAFPLLVVLSISRSREGLRGLRRHWKTGTLGGVLSVGAYGLVIWAMTQGPMALVSALRETSVVLAAVIGTTFLHEPFGRARVLASVGVAAGVIVLRLAS